MSKIKVVPCSGIGKVFGLMSREAALMVSDELAPDIAETACLAHIVTGDAEVVKEISGQKCITIDGCNAYCAAKSVKEAGGIVCEKYRSIDGMKNHRGKDAGDATALSDDGWVITTELAEKVAAKAREIAKEDKGNE